MIKIKPSSKNFANHCISIKYFIKCILLRKIAYFYTLNQKEMNKKKANYRTDFLLPKNNFLVGLGSVLNIAGAYFSYNFSKSEAAADYKSIYSDWKNVGEDFKVSKRKFKKENKDKLCLNF